MTAAHEHDDLHHLVDRFTPLRAYMRTLKTASGATAQLVTRSLQT